MAERVLPLPPLRPEREVTLDTMGAVGDVARPLTPFERISNITAVRRLVVLVVLCAAWEVYARVAANPLLFPSFTETMEAWWDALVRGPLLERTLHIAAGAGHGLRHRARAGGLVHHHRGVDPGRHRPPFDA